MGEDARRMMEEEFDIRTIVSKTIRNITCKYLYNSNISGAVAYTTRQLNITLTEDQKEEAVLRVAKFLENM